MGTKFSILRSTPLFLVAMVATGCMQGVERLEEKARIEGQAQSDVETRAANANLAAKARLMEADLAGRHQFYQAVKGIYEGGLTTERGEFKVRITLVPSFVPVTYERTRQLEEITADLNNLDFSAQVIQWNPANPLSAVGCTVENIRPDIFHGEISIVSSSCPNLYKLTIGDGEAKQSGTDPEAQSLRDKELSRKTAAGIRDGKIVEVSEIRGEVYPSTNASVYSLTVHRIVER